MTVSRNYVKWLRKTGQRIIYQIAPQSGDMSRRLHQSAYYIRVILKEYPM